MTTTNGAPDKPRPTAPPDFWVVPWPQTLVTPELEGGPADGFGLEPRPRCELPLAIHVPIAGGGQLVYRLGRYRVGQPFTAVYR